MALNRTFKLNNGNTIPALGLGTWRSEVGKAANAVKVALDAGYKHIDCAYIYQNEHEIGQVFEKLSNRESIFITSKLWNSFHGKDQVKPAFEKTLGDLKLEYLDLYLMHWPVTQDPETKENRIDPASIKVAWQEMEKLVDSGEVKSIGVSNFNINRLTELLQYARIKPAVNQVELHPYLPQTELLAFCAKHGIHVTAYSPLGSTPGPETVLNDQVVADIAKKHDKTNAQVLISWAIQRGTSVIPKSVTPERIESNFQDFVLSDEEMKQLNELHVTKAKRYVDPKGFFKVDVYEE
jgi:diketogulonate reductase-like aldo/keto reductase